VFPLLSKQHTRFGGNHGSTKYSGTCQAGNAKIAALVTHLQPNTAQAARKDSCLQIMLEAAKCQINKP